MGNRTQSREFFVNSWNNLFRQQNFLIQPNLATLCKKNPWENLVQVSTSPSTLNIYRSSRAPSVTPSHDTSGSVHQMNLAPFLAFSSSLELMALPRLPVLLCVVVVVLSSRRGPFMVMGHLARASSLKC